MDSLSQGISTVRGAAGSTQSSYVFHGPIGFVQTGAGSSANVVQNLGADDKKALLNAIQDIKQLLEKAKEMAASDRQELTELLQESSNELKKPKPNSMRIRAILTQIGQAIQIFASLRPAYQSLKAALLSLGITLP